MNRIQHSCFCIIKFIKLTLRKRKKCSTSLAFYLVFQTRLINSIKHEHSCKIHYIFFTHVGSSILKNLEKCIWILTAQFNDVARTLKKYTHIKGRLLDQAVILFDCVPFHNGNLSERKEFAPSQSKLFPLRSVSYGIENHFYQLGALP